jgi:hypothetical protein
MDRVTVGITFIHKLELIDNNAEKERKKGSGVFLFGVMALFLPHYERRQKM